MRAEEPLIGESTPLLTGRPNGLGGSTPPSSANVEVVQPLVVCDGWTNPRHPRVVLRDGDPARVSHGMCEACKRAMEEQR